LNYLIYFLGERKAENPERKRERVEMEMECAEKFSYLMQPGPIPTWLKAPSQKSKLKEDPFIEKIVFPNWSKIMIFQERLLQIKSYIIIFLKMVFFLFYLGVKKIHIHIMYILIFVLKYKPGLVQRKFLYHFLF